LENYAEYANVSKFSNTLFILHAGTS